MFRGNVSPRSSMFGNDPNIDDDVVTPLLDGTVDANVARGFCQWEE
jgi:hypothetical protein